MTGVDFSLLIGAAIAALICARSPRSLLWLAVAAASYIVSVIYWRSGAPYPEAVAGLCDAAVCLAVYFWGRFRWEMWIWHLFQISLGINILYLAGNLEVFIDIGHDAYSIMLEAINWLLLIFLSGTASLQRLGLSHGMATGPWVGVRRFVMALGKERQKPPFTKAGR